MPRAVPEPALSRPRGRRTVGGAADADWRFWLVFARWKPHGYSPEARDFRPEKRYSGGKANELYIFDLASHDAKLISEGPRASRDPMWIGKKIYFNSDRDGHFNLYAYDTETGKTAQVTHNALWDVRWPGTDRQRRIVYELDGELQVLDVATGVSAAIAVNVPDDGINRRPSWISAADHIESAGLSPKGERVLFSARGDIFSAPVEKGPTRNLTHSPGAHDKWPAWSPDGSKVAYISDASGEEEIYVVAQDGSSPAEQITSGGQAFRYEPKWSPDGKRIAFSDKDGRVLGGHGGRSQAAGSGAFGGQHGARLCVVSGGRMAGVQHERQVRIFGDLFLEQRGRQASSCDQRLVQRRHARRGTRRAIIFIIWPITSFIRRSRRSSLTSRRTGRAGFSFWPFART